MSRVVLNRSFDKSSSQCEKSNSQPPVTPEFAEFSELPASDSYKRLQNVDKFRRKSGEAYSFKVPLFDALIHQSVKEHVQVVVIQELLYLIYMYLLAYSRRIVEL